MTDNKDNKKTKEYTKYEQNMKQLLEELAEKGSASLKEDKIYLDRITEDIIIPFLQNHLKRYCLSLMKPMQMTQMDGVGECAMKLLNKMDYILQVPADKQLGMVQTIAQNHIYSLYRSHARHLEPTLTMDEPFWEVTADTLADPVKDAAETEAFFAQRALMLECLGEMALQKSKRLPVIFFLAKTCAVKKEKLYAALQKYGDIPVAIALMERLCQKLDISTAVFPIAKLRALPVNYYQELSMEKLEKKINNSASYCKKPMQQRYKERKLKKYSDAEKETDPEFPC